ncbi:stromal membrane-associated GTPase-activating protein 2 [Pelomyxa schiedti]|nr:stromal membrane-associated GTPase-activating protein 2 [Pelomyxa schiedti]
MATSDDIDVTHARAEKRGKERAEGDKEIRGVHERRVKPYATDIGSVADELRNMSNLDKTSPFGRAITQLSGTLKSISGIHHAASISMAQKLSGISVFVDFDFLEFNESVKRLDRLKNEYEALVAKISSGVKNVQGDPAALQAKIDECKLSVIKNLGNLDSKKDTRLLATLLEGVDELVITQDKVTKVLGLLKKKSLEMTKHVEEMSSRTVKVQKEGILVKRGKLGPNKIFVVLREGLIFQLRPNKDFDPASALSVIMCTVRPVSEDNRKFEILSPQLKKSWQFEAESEGERNEWMKEIQNSIAINLNSLSASSTATKTSQDPQGEMAPATNFSTLSPREIDYLHSIPGNSTCIDCDCPAPDWASINLGVLMCLECSGVHRAMGTHISKVRSLTLDKWNPDMLLYMKHCGNKKINEILESISPLPIPKPCAKSERALRETFIKTKYESKKFVPQQSMSQDEINKALYIATQNANVDVKAALQLVVAGADTNWVDTDDALGRAPLHHAVFAGNPLLLELLLQNGANTSATDNKGWTALHYACFYNRPRAAMRLLQVSQKLLRVAEESGVIPSDLAMWNESYDTVAVLKGCPLAKLDLTMDTVVNHPEALIADVGFEPKRNAPPQGSLSEHLQTPSLKRSASLTTPGHSLGPPSTPPPPPASPREAAPPSTPPPSMASNLTPPAASPTNSPLSSSCSPPLSPAQRTTTPHTPLATFTPLEEDEVPPPPPPPPGQRKHRRRQRVNPPPPPEDGSDSVPTAVEESPHRHKRQKERLQVEGTQVSCTEPSSAAAAQETEKPNTVENADRKTVKGESGQGTQNQTTEKNSETSENSATQPSTHTESSSEKGTLLTASNTSTESKPKPAPQSLTPPPKPIKREKHRTQISSIPPRLFAQPFHPLRSSSDSISTQRGIQIGMRHGRTGSVSEFTNRTPPNNT